MNIFKSDEPIEISEHMIKTYQTLRVVLCVIALIFPWLLWGGGCLSSHELKLQGSMSAYYHADKISDREFAERTKPEHVKVPLESGNGVMRNWFIGLLFAISGLLFVYKGFRPAEDVALNLAAIFAALVALFPTSWDDKPGIPLYGIFAELPLHGAFAVCFFLCIAYVCIFCASATLPLVKEEKHTYYRRLYKLLGYAMVLSPIVAVILTYTLNFRDSFIFFAELCGVYAFAIYWLVKTIEIRETDADRKAAQGELLLAPGKGASDAIRELPVIDIEKQQTEVTGATQ